MARLARLEVGGGWYYVINRGHQRRVIYRDRRCYQNFLQRLSQFPDRFGVKVDSYVLMPNHYYLLLELGAKPSLSTAMHWLNTGYGIWFSRRYSQEGALFQGRFKGILFDPDECLLAIHYYLHLNPVRVGALKEVETQSDMPDKTRLQLRRQVLGDYEWSSYRDYAGLRAPSSWLTLDTIRERTGLSLKDYRRELDQRITRDQPGLDWQGELAAGILLGSQQAVGAWKRLLVQRTGGNRRKETPGFALISWNEITAALEQEYRLPWPELCPRRGNPARAMAIWFARHRGGMSLEQIRVALGASSYIAVAMHVGRLQRQLPKNAQLRRQLQAVAKTAQCPMLRCVPW